MSRIPPLTGLVWVSVNYLLAPQFSLERYRVAVAGCVEWAREKSVYRSICWSDTVQSALHTFGGCSYLCQRLNRKHPQSASAGADRRSGLLQ